MSAERGASELAAFSSRSAFFSAAFRSFGNRPGLPFGTGIVRCNLTNCLAVSDSFRQLPESAFRRSRKPAGWAQTGATQAVFT